MHTCLSVYMCIICTQEPVIITRGTEFPRNGVNRDIELPGGGTWVLRKSSKCSWPLCSRPWTCLSVYVFIQLWVDLLLPRRVPQLLKQGEPLEGLCAISHVFSSVWSCSLPTTSATHLHPLLWTPRRVWNAESSWLVFPYRPTHWTPFICMLLT